MIDDDLLRDDEAEVSVGSTFDEEYYKSKHVEFSATAIFRLSQGLSIRATPC